jgi:CHAT domain-containing protein/tetratricopeptide (TPR) repeat protein
MTRRAAWVVIAIACASSVARATPKKQVPAASVSADVEAQLRKLDEAWNAAYGKQDHARVLEVAKQAYALQVKATGEGSPDAERRKSTFATAALEAADYPTAEKLFLQIIATRSKQTPERSYELTEPLGNLISVYERQFRFGEIDPLWARILAVVKQVDGERSEENGRQLLGYARSLKQRNELSAAVRTYEQAIAVFDAVTKTKADPYVFAAVAEVAYLYLRMNQEAKAIAAYDRAIQISEQLPSGNSISRVTMLWGVGVQYFHNGRKDLAAKLFDRAIATCVRDLAALEKSTPKDPLIGDLYSELGLLYSYQHETAKAVKAYTKALELAKKNGKAGAAGGALAEVLRSQGKVKEAYELLAQARSEFPPSKLPNFYDLMLADIKRELGETKAAQKLIKSYLAAVVGYYGKRNPTYAYGAFKAVDIYAAGGDLAAAERQLTEVLAVSEQALTIALRSGTDSDHVTYAAQNSNVLDAALSFNVTFAPRSASAARLGLTTLLRRKGRVIDASAAALATIRSKLSPEDKKLLDELTAARARLAKISIAGSPDLDKQAKDIAALEDLVQRLEAQVSRKSTAYRQAIQAIDLPAIQKLIPKDVRLVEIANYEPLDGRRAYSKIAAQPHLPRRYLAYVVAGKGDPELVDLGEAAPIEAAIEKLRKALADPDNDQAASLGNALYALTMAKIVPKLGGATSVLIAPDGALNVVPFSALVDDRKQFLIKNYTFTYLTSGRDLQRLSIKTKAQGGGVLFADPTFDATAPAAGKTRSRGQRSAALSSLSWPQLPGTAAEADAVLKTFKGFQVFRGAAATEGTVKKVKGPNVLHLATHGFFLPDEHPEATPGSTATPAPSENPMLRSGLAFAGANKLSSGEDDGLLTALEASGLDLHGTKLVVLSACETGIGKVTNGDGVYGLRRALVIAGAESLVMSMWQVDDFATKELMAGFYKKLAAGTPRSTALRETQLQLLSNPKYAHPFFWAAFLPAGATTPLKD